MKSKKKKAVRFTLNGKAFDFAQRKQPPSAAKLTAMLDALPMGTLLDNYEVCERAGYGRMTVFSNIRMGHFDAYRLKLSSRRIYWGNRRTIAMARKELANRENA